MVTFFAYQCLLVPLLSATLTQTAYRLLFDNGDKKGLSLMTFRAYNIVREKKATKIWLWTTEINLKPEKCLLCRHQNDLLLLGKGQVYLCDCAKCDFKLGER